MSSRGKKSRCTIAGYTLTFAELYVLNTIRKAMDGKRTGVPLRDIFDDDKSNAKRHVARRLGELKVLSACQIELQNDVLTTIPF
jgi:hypothetical protein